MLPQYKTRKSNFRFGLKHKGNDLDALYDNWWLVAYASHVTKYIFLNKDFIRKSTKTTLLTNYIHR